MDLDSLTTAGTLAIAMTMAFLGLAKLWHVVSGLVAGHTEFPDSTMREAAQRLRDETEKLYRAQSSYLAALVICTMIFVSALGLGVSGLYQDYPEWQLRFVVGLLVFAALWILYKIARSLLLLSRARFERDACIAVGHQLHRLTTSHGAVFHDVRVGQQVIDHVLVGSGGIYAINVVARSGRHGSASLIDETLSLGADTELRLDAYTNRVHKLSANFSKVAKHAVRVRSVIAVPGWEVSEQRSNKHLLVNERTLPMLTGWRAQSDYLMNEHVVAIQTLLTEKGKRRR